MTCPLLVDRPVPVHPWTEAQKATATEHRPIEQTLGRCDPRMSRWGGDTAGHAAEPIDRRRFRKPLLYTPELRGREGQV